MMVKISAQANVRFVYVRGTRGPAPQVWFCEQLNVLGAEPFTFCQHPLKPGEEKLSIEELQKRYPAPAETELG